MRRAMPAQFGLLKTNALAMALCRLHNFCIDRRLLKSEKPLAVDEAEMQVHGGVQLEEHVEHGCLRNPQSPEKLIRREEHFDDTSRAHMRQLERQAVRALEASEQLPRDDLHESVIRQDKHRPTPQQWEMRGHGGH